APAGADAAHRAPALPGRRRARDRGRLHGGARGLPRRRGRRGHHRRRDPGAAPRTVPGAPGVKTRRVAAALLAAVAVACATARPKGVPNEADDYVYPAWTPAELSQAEGRDLEKAWRAVLAGQGTESEKRFRDLLRRHPGSAAAEAGVGYALLRQGRAP